MVAAVAAVAMVASSVPAGYAANTVARESVQSAASDEIELRPLDAVETAATAEALGIPDDILHGRSTVYGFGDGSAVVVRERARDSRFSIGLGRALYVYLNQTDQKAVKAGGGTAIGLAVCALPAVGQGACAGVMVVVSMALVYLTKNGFCPRAKSTLELRTAGLGVSARAMCIKR
jgi:hypothetical protein